MRSALKQVAWYDCSRDRRAVPVRAPGVRPGYRSVVTYIVKSGTQLSTGTVLARVADQPLIAVETSGVFYRDLARGDEGDDVRNLKRALRAAGLSVTPGDVMDARTVEAWKRHFDSTSPSDRVRVSTVVAVPDKSEADNITATVGQAVRHRDALLQVGGASKSFRCEVPDPPSGITSQKVQFKVGERIATVSEVIVHRRSSTAPGSIEVVPEGKVGVDLGQLGIVASQTPGRVLAVPLSAVKAEADGSQAVVVLDGATTHSVPVSLGVTADGVVEVAPKSDELAEGTQVVLFDASDPVSSPASGSTSISPELAGRGGVSEP